MCKLKKKFAINIIFYFKNRTLLRYFRIADAAENKYQHAQWFLNDWSGGG